MGADEKSLVTELAEHVSGLLAAPSDSETLKLAIARIHPADLAEVLDKLEDEDRDRVIGLLDPEFAVEVIDEASDEQKAAILAKLSVKKIVQVLDRMPPDEAVEILDHIGEEQSDAVLQRLGGDHAEDIRGLSGYEPETAGRIMTTGYLAIQRDRTAGEVLREAREHTEDIETYHHIMVINPKGRLVGEVTMEELFRAEPETPVRDLVDRGVISIHAARDQEVAARMMEKYDLAVLPVVEDRGVLVGIITFDDIMEVMHEEADEDIYRLAGIGADEPLVEGVFQRARKRLPWLTTTLVGGLCLAGIIAHFQPTLDRVLALVSFIPVIAGLGGNVGIQSSTITVRGLATGEVAVGDLFWLLRRELAVGAIIGLVCAVVLALAAHLFLGVISPERLSPTVDLFRFVSILGLAVLCGILVAAFIGTMAPLACHRFGVDPAVAAGPFVTITIDVVTQTLYLAIATLLLL